MLGGEDASGRNANDLEEFALSLIATSRGKIEGACMAEATSRETKQRQALSAVRSSGRRQGEGRGALPLLFLTFFSPDAEKTIARLLLTFACSLIYSERRHSVL